MKVLPRACETRWISLYRQAKAILELETPVKLTVDWMLGDVHMPVIGYQPVDWTNTRAVVELLTVFAEAVDLLESGIDMTNNMMPFLCRKLHAYITTKASLQDLPAHVRQAANEMFDEFGTCFETPTNAQKIAFVCDPRLKKLRAWEGIEVKLVRRIVIAAMTKMRVSNRRPLNENASAADESGGPACPPKGEGEPDDDESASSRKRKRSEAAELFVNFMKEFDDHDADKGGDLASRNADDVAEIQREMEQELAFYEDRQPLSKNASSEDVLSWWTRNKRFYPTLHRVAHAYLAVPAICATSERLSSAAGDVITAKRDALAPDSVADVVFLHGCSGCGWTAASDHEITQAD